MGWNKSAENSKYNAAKKAYDNSIADYKSATRSYKVAMGAAQRRYDDATRNAENEYKATLDKYTGNKGYNNSVRMAKQNAGDISMYQASGAANTARTAARNAGMTRAQAAAMASDQVANAYNNAYAQNFNTQQSQAAAQGSAAVAGQLQGSQMAASNALNSAGLTDKTYGTYAGNLGNVAGSNLQAMSVASGEYANEYNRRRQNAGDYSFGLANLSDERLKEYRKIDGVLKKRMKRDYKKLEVGK